MQKLGSGGDGMGRGARIRHTRRGAAPPGRGGGAVVPSVRSRLRKRHTVQREHEERRGKERRTAAAVSQHTPIASSASIFAWTLRRYAATPAHTETHRATVPIVTVGWKQWCSQAKASRLTQRFTCAPSIFIS